MTDRLDSRLVKHQVAQASRKLEIGWMGYLFGAANEKPGNVAGLAVTLSFVFIGAILVWGPNDAAFPKKEAVTLFGGIIVGSLGFLFGRGR